MSEDSASGGARAGLLASPDGGEDSLLFASGCGPVRFDFDCSLFSGHESKAADRSVRSTQTPRPSPTLFAKYAKKDEPPGRRERPQGLKPAFLLGLGGTAEQAAEKVAVRRPAPKGASDFEELTVSLKRYPDTNLSFSAGSEAVPFPFVEKVRSFRSAEALHHITPKPGVLGAPALRHQKQEPEWVEHPHCDCGRGNCRASLGLDGRGRSSPHELGYSSTGCASSS